MPQDNPVWLTTREAAKRLGVAHRRLYELIDVGELPAYREADDLRLSASDVDAYLTRNPPA